MNTAAQLEQAAKQASGTAEALRSTLRAASALEAFAILPLIKSAVELQQQIEALQLAIAQS